MSAQRKNKRLGSRRRVANQNEIPEADVLHVTDNPIAQPHIPEENSGFLNLLCNPDKSQSEPQCPPEPANRRKLGSRRKNKERQHVKDSATESYYEPENESEEKTRGREAVETALSLMSQSEKQEQSSHRSVHDMSATADSSLCSGTTHGYEFQNSTLKGNSLMNESHVESVVVGFSTTAEMATDENSPRQNTELEYGTEAATTEELPPDEDQNEHFFLPLEPQPEDNSVSIDLQTNTDFNPVGNRRKLGSSRRSKGSQPVKDSIANLYHKAQDEVVENVRANEAIEIAKMSLLVETEVLTDTHQTKTPGSPVRETEHLVGISDLNNSSLHPSLAFNQQLIGQSNVREKPDELPDVYCVTEKDTTERDDDTDLLLQWGILQANYLVSESHMKSESIEPSITVITTERKSPGEHTEPESVGEQAVEISPKKLTVEENDHFELAQVSRGQHSENTVNKVHGQEVKPTQRQEHDSSLHSASTPSYSSEVQIPTPTNCPEADLECLIPIIETDVKVEMSVESLEATLEGMDKSDTLQSEDEGVNHSQGAVNTICEQVVKAEQMQELHDIHYYFQSIKHDTAENSDNCSVNLKTQDELRHAYQSELTVKNTDSASKQEVSNPGKQDDHHTTENKIQALDQINEDFHVYDNEKPHTSDIEGLDTAISQVYEIKGQGEDNIMPSAGQTSDQEKENNGENEALRTRCMLLVERKSVEELSQESKHEIIMSVTHEAGFEVEVSVESATLERTDTSDTLQSGEAKGINYSEDKLHEPTQMQKMSQTEYASESVIPCVPKNFEIISLNLTGQAEIEDAHQFELSVKSTEDSATKQEVSNPDNKHEHPTKENFESLDQINEDTRKSQMSDVERLDATVGHVYEPDGQGEADIKPSAEQTSQVEKGHFSEVEKTEPSLQTLQSEIHASLDYQPQDNSVSTNEQINTNFGPSGNRRKLGSSRRNKGRQHVKPLETTKMSLASQVKWQEELSQESEDDIMSVTHDSSLHSASTSEVQIPTPTTCPEADLECLIPKSEILLEEHDERETDLKVEMSVESLEATLEETDKSDTLQSEDEGVNHSEDAVHTICEQEVKPEQMYEIYETCYSFKSVLHDTTENSDTCKGNLKDQTEPRDTYQSEIIVKSTDDPALQSEDKGITHSENKVHEQEVKPAQMQDMSQIEYSSESVILHATENSEIISLNPTGQTEIKDTTQFELSVKSTDDSAAMQEVSNPDNKHEHPTKENNLDALDQINEDTRKPQTSDTERLDAAVGQLYETEGQGAADIKPSPEQSGQWEKEGLFSEVKKSEFSLQSHRSEIHNPFDTQPWDDSVTTGEQNDAEFNPTGNGKHKGRQHVKDSVAESYWEGKQEDVENIRGHEPIETTKPSLALQAMRQEESSQENEHEIIMSVIQDSSLFPVLTPGYSSEVQIPTPINCPEALLEGLIPKSENLQEVHGKRASDLEGEASVESVKATQEGTDKFDTLQSGEDEEVNYSEDKAQEPTQMQEMSQTECSSESVIPCVPKHFEIISLNLTGQAEIEDAHQFELSVKSTDDSATKQEVSNPDNKHEHPTKENFESLDQINEDTRKSQMSDVERLDATVGHVYEPDGQGEADIKPSAEQTSQVEKGHFSEVEKTEPSLQTLQSEIHASLDYQPQDNSVSTNEQINTYFGPSGNRRKLGSSRRNKGRQHVKPLETTKMSLASQVKWQEELSQESEDDIMSVTHDSSLHSASTSEVQIPTPTTCPEADLECLIPKSEILQEEHDERETDLKVEMSVESLEATLEETDKSDTLQSEDKGVNHTEDAVHTICEQEVKPEQMYEIYETCYSFKSVLHDTTENSDTCKGNLKDQTEPRDTYQSEIIVKSTDDPALQSEDKGITHSENKVHEQEVKPAQMQDMSQIEYSSESVILHATENSEIISLNPTGQAEIKDTTQFELSVKSTDDSAAMQEVSNPDNKHEHPTKENNLDALDQINEDTRKPQTSDTERLDAAVGQLYETEGQGAADIKPSPEQSGQWEKEGLFSEVEKSEFSLQSHRSEIHNPFDTQPWDDSVTTGEQNDAEFNPTGNGKHKGRQHVKDSVAESYWEGKQEDVENIRGHEPIETTKPSLALQAMRQEESSQENEHEIIMSVTQDSSLFPVPTPGYSSEVQIPTPINCPEALLEGLIPKSENLQEVHGKRASDLEGEASVESVKATQEGTDKFDTLQSGEDEEVNYSEDKAQEPTQMQEMSQTECSSESVIPCVPKHFEIISLNLTGQAEIEDAHQFELSVKSTDDSATKQEVSNPDNKHEHPTKENFESLDQINEDTRKSQMSDVERLDATVGHVYEPDGQGEADIKPSAEQTSQVEKGHFSEVEKTEPSLQTLQSEIHASLDYQPQDNSVSTNEQINTYFGPSGNRRKLGSSRRNKGRQHVKPLETTKMSLASQVKWQEELSQESEHDIMSVMHDSSLHSASTPEVQIPTPTNCPEADLECLIPKSEILLEEHDKRETDLKVEMSVESLEATLEETDKSDTLQSEDKGVNHSEDAVNTMCEQEAKPEQMYEIYETCYSFKSVLHDTAENSDTCKGNLKDQTEPRDTYQSEIIVKSTDDPALQSEDKGITHSENKVHEQEVKPAQMQDMSQLEYSSESVILHATENSEIISLNPTGQAEIKDTTQFELSVKSTDDSAAMQEVSNPDNKHEHPTKENNLDALDQINEDTRKSQTSDTERLDAAVGQLYETEGQGETDIKPSAEQMSPQKEEHFSEVEKTKLSLQSHQSETYTPFDSQPWDKHVVMDEQNKAHFNPTGNRRKLGSSRRNKGGRHVNGCSYKQEDLENIRGLEPLETTKMSLALQEMGQEESSQESEHVAESYQIPTQELVGNTMGNKRLETPKMSLTTETAIQEISMESMLEVMDKFDTSQTGDISDAHIDTYELNSISVHSNSTVAQPVIDQSNSRKMPDKDIPHMYSATDTEIKEGDNDTDFILQCEILQANDLKPEGNRPYITLEITPENNSCREQTEPECSVEKVAVSSPKEELLTDEEQNEHFSLCKVRGAQHTETAVKKVHTEEDNPEPIQEMHQIDYISVKESKSSLQTLQSEEHACLDSHPKDNFQSTKEETHTGFKPTGNRRKLGSSRRNKGKQHVLDSGTETYQQPKEKVVENTETINIPLSTESTKQQIDTGFKPAEKIRQIRSTLNEGENTEKVPEDTLSQNVMDISTAVTADITSRSDKDDFHKFSEKVNEEEKKHNLKESENSTLLTGYDRVKTDLIQSSEASVCNDDSDIRIISYHDDNITFRSITSDVLCQEEVFQVQAMETLPYDKDLLGQQIHIQQTNFVIEMVGDEVGRSIQQHGQDQVEESCEHPTKKGQDEHLEGKSKQKKRKIGSTRRTGLLRKQEEETGNTDEAKESNLHTEIDMRDLDSTEVVEDLPLIVTTELAQNETAQPSLSTVVEVQQETSSVCDLGQNLQSSTSDLHTIECNMIAKTDDLMALLSEQSASHHETVVNPVTFIHGADVRNYGEIVGAGEEPSEGDDFTSTVMVTERNRHSVNQLLPPNTEDAVNTDSGITVTFCEISPSTQNDEQSPDDTKVIQDQDLKSSEEEPTNAKASIQKPMNEEAHNINIVMKKASPNFSSANRRRKMGSTRRNLGSHHKGEDLHQKQDVDNEATATDVGDVLSKGVSGIKEDLQLQKEHTESDLQKGKEKVFETVKYSHTGVSQLKVLAQQAVEEDLPSLSNILETEHQLTSDDFSAKPSTSPKRDTMSESISGGRRRKMGSHRKSSGHHTHETATEGREIDAEQGRDVRGLTDEEHRKESLGLDKISEVDESGTKPSSNISRSKGGGPTRPESEKAPKQVPAVQHCYAEVRLGQESQRKISLEGDSTGLGVRSKSYNVVMVGDASVGKTSFMKRAQSGKFSLDLPSSVGLDSCMWTVVVDGKPVVLQLWDTAGQERFRSITRQIFHKAHAFLLMYDIASSQSFSAVSYWADCIQEGAAENMSILLLGNKSDHEKRQVNTQQGEILAKEYQFEFMECSAATGENVIHSLETVARMLIQKFDTREEAVVLHKEPQQKKKSGCC